MAIPSYTLGYPQDGSSLGNSKAVIRNNLDGTFLNMSVEHFSQNSATPGLHMKSTYPAGTRRSTATGQINLYAKAVTGGTALFTSHDNTGSSGEVQLTTPAVTPSQHTAYITSFLPGGTVIVSGSVAQVFTGTHQIVNFTIPYTFSTKIMSACVNLIQNDSNNLASINVLTPLPSTSNLNKISFVYNVTNSTSNYIGFSYIIIGF